MLPIADRHVGYAQGVARELTDDGIRVRVDERTESIGKKIRDAETKKIPYMLVVGDQEEADGLVAVRRHRRGRRGRRAGQGVHRAGHRRYTRSRMRGSNLSRF